MLRYFVGSQKPNSPLGWLALENTVDVTVLTMPVEGALAGVRCAMQNLISLLP